MKEKIEYELAGEIECKTCVVAEIRTKTKFEIFNKYEVLCDKCYIGFLEYIVDWHDLNISDTRYKEELNMYEVNRCKTCVVSEIRIKTKFEIFNKYEVLCDRCYIDFLEYVISKNNLNISDTTYTKYKYLLELERKPKRKRKKSSERKMKR